MILCSIKILENEHTNSNITIVDPNLISTFVGNSTSSVNDTQFNILLDTTRKLEVQNVLENKDTSTPNIHNILKDNNANSNLTWIQYVSFNYIQTLQFNLHKTVTSGLLPFYTN